jgi:hypothetical protein
VPTSIETSLRGLARFSFSGGSVFHRFFPDNDMPKKRLLSPDEMLKLVNLMKEAFDQIARLRTTDPLAEWIQYPKVPSVLSESLIVHLINRGELIAGGPGDHARLGGKKADVLYRCEDLRESKVEVKASAREAFSEFVKKDTLADYLVWVHFGESFLQGLPFTAEILFVEAPSQFFNPGKMTLPRFKALAGAQLQTITVDTECLRENLTN